MKNAGQYIVFLVFVFFSTDANASNKKKLLTNVTAINGESKFNNGAGGRTLFLPQKAKLSKYKNDYLYRKNKIVSQGEISSFSINGIKYTAQFTKNGYFYEYVDSAFNPYQFSVDIDDKTYKINSLQTLYGRDDNYNYTGAFSGITELTDSNFNQILSHFRQVYQKKYSNKYPFWAVLAESLGGEYDYKNKVYELLHIPKENLLLINGILYNANEAGNFLWAYALAYYDCKLSPIFLAEYGTFNRYDEVWEQRAIENGMKKFKN